jgi:predicted amidohydrolase
MKSNWKLHATKRGPLGRNDVRVAVVQFRSQPEIARNASRIISALTEAAKRGAHVVAFPECALTSYDADAILSLTATAIAEGERAVADACRRLRIAAIFGTVDRTKRTWRNAAVVIDRTGRLKARYHKEYLVGRDRVWHCVAGEQLPPVFPIGAAQASVTVCHDNRYPELSRLPVLAGAQIMFHLSHEGDLSKRSKLGPSRAQMQARAVENGVFVVHANAPSDGGTRGSHGESRIIGPDGNILLEASQRREEILMADLDLELATRSFALNSLRGPHRRWWQQGVRKVPMVR